MRRKILTSLCCAILIVSFSGCQLARDDAAAQAYDDRLIGVFITTKYLDLFDFEGYINDNLNGFSGGEIKMGGETEGYQGRIYATLVSSTLTSEETGETIQTQDYVFEDIEGIAYFAARMPFREVEGDSYISSSNDEGLSDGHMSVAVTDEGNSITLEGTVYVALSDQFKSFFINPVYQSADGSVYLTSGTGISSQMSAEGSRMSQSMDQTTTIAENGVQTKESLSVTVSISVISLAQKIVIVQMAADNTPLSQTEYTPQEMPEAFSPDKDAEYIIVEEYKSGADRPTRNMYNNDAQSIEYFILRDDDICIKRSTLLEWRASTDNI